MIVSYLQESRRWHLRLVRQYEQYEVGIEENISCYSTETRKRVSHTYITRSIIFPPNWITQERRRSMDPKVGV